MAAAFEYEFEVGPESVDANGHVNNGAINQYFEDGRVHFRNARMGTLGSAILTGFAIRRFTHVERGELVEPPRECGRVFARHVLDDHHRR